MMKRFFDTGEIGGALMRFPLAVFCSVAAALLMLTAKPAAMLVPAQALSAGCFLSIAAVLIAESRNWPRIAGFTLGAGLTALAYLAFAGLSGQGVFTLSVLNLAIILSMFIAPFIRRGGSDEAFWLFAYRLSLRILQTTIVTAILFGGFAAIFGASTYLLGLKIPAVAYMKLWIFVTAFFAPLFAIAGIPRNFDDADDERGALIRVQCITQAYIVVPLLTVFAAILYAYSVKIAVQWSLPKGNVANIVMAFAGIGTVVYFAVYGLRSGYRTLELFVASYFKILFPVLILLGVAIATRVGDYGLTEERYTLLAALIFFVMAGIIDLLAPKIRLRGIFALLLIMLLIAAIGPFSAANLSLRSQDARLRSLTASLGLVNDRALSGQNRVVSFADRKQLSSSLDYMLASDAGRKRLQQWLDVRDSTAAQVMQKAGLGYVNRWQKMDDDAKNRFSYYAKDRTPGIAVSGFDILLPVQLYARSDGEFAETKGYRVLFSKDHRAVLIKDDQGKIFTLPLDDILKDVPDADRAYRQDGVTDGMRFRLLVRSMNGRIVDGKPVPDGIDGTLLIGKAP